MLQAEDLVTRKVELDLDELITLSIGQSCFGGVGSVVWDGALVATKYFEKRYMQDRNAFRDKNILELGAGTGICSLALAVMGWVFCNIETNT